MANYDQNSLEIESLFSKMLTDWNDGFVSKDITQFLEANLSLSEFESNRQNFKTTGRLPVKRVTAHVQTAHSLINFWKNLYLLLTVKVKEMRNSGWDLKNNSDVLFSIVGFSDSNDDDVKQEYRDGSNQDLRRDVEIIKFESADNITGMGNDDDEHTEGTCAMVKESIPPPDRSSKLKNRRRKLVSVDVEKNWEIVKDRESESEKVESFPDRDLKNGRFRKKYPKKPRGVKSSDRPSDTLKTFKCRLCGELLWAYDHLLVTHGNTYAKACPICEEDDLEDVLYHLNVVHFKKTPRNCEFCSYISFDEEDYVNHVQKHLAVKKMRCVKCRLWFPDKDSLDVHLESEQHANQLAKKTVASG